MGNPFNIGPFNCCSCPEPPGFDAETDDPMAKYINMCGCPSVAIVCVSEQKTATLCGFPEFTNANATPPIVISIPPIRYLRRYMAWLSYSRDSYSCSSFCDPNHYKSFTSSLNNGFMRDDKFQSVIDAKNVIANPDSTTQEIEDAIENVKCYASSRGVVTDIGAPSFNRRSWTCSGGTVSDLDPGSVRSVPNTPNATIINNTKSRYESVGTTYFEPGSPCAGELKATINHAYETTLSIPDTEEDALARANPTDGSSCSSINQLRTTSFSWTERTVTYTATAENLVIGVAYEGCVRIQRREAYRGTEPDDADTAWEDVEPDTIASFTPTETIEVVATNEALPFAKGYEYEVVGAYVWPVSAGCDCPTSYVAP